MVSNSHIEVNNLDEMSPTIQSMPCISPRPVNALQEMMAQCLVSIPSISKNSFIWLIVIASWTSCLLQKISREAPMSFSCLSNSFSSFLHSCKRNLSVESTTQIKPSVSSK